MNDPVSNILLYFYKNPIPGKVKTRIASTMGDAAALSIYRFLAGYVRDQTIDSETLKIVYYSDAVENEDIWNKDHFLKQIQMGSDLGQRMSRAFEETFEAHGNGSNIGLIGTDLYPLPADIIEAAYSMLESADVVIGPAKDGGYYFIGMKQHYPELFSSIPWSTSKVFSATIDRCKSLDLDVGLLPILSDIDTEKDVKDSGLLSVFNPEK